MSIDNHSNIHSFPKLLLQVSYQERHKIMVSTLEEFGLKEARYAENNTIIYYLTLRNILPPQLKNISARYKVMCGCECCISAKIMHSYLLSWHYYYL